MQSGVAATLLACRVSPVMAAGGFSFALTGGGRVDPDAGKGKPKLAFNTAAQIKARLP